MTITSYLKDRVAPLWRSLTPAQRSAWHFFAEDNPITNTAGELVTVNGWQIFVHVNSWLSIPDVPLMLGDPPADLARPAPFNLPAQAWPTKLKLPAGTTYRAGRVFLLVEPPIPDNRVVFLLRTSEYFSRQPTPPWRLAKISVIAPGFSGLHDLTTRSGYNLSTPGSKYDQRHRIIGPWARAHPDERVGRLIIVSTDNGMSAAGSITNSG